MNGLCGEFRIPSPLGREWMDGLCVVFNIPSLLGREYSYNRYAATIRFISVEISASSLANRALFPLRVVQNFDPTR